MRAVAGQRTRAPCGVRFPATGLSGTKAALPCPRARIGACFSRRPETWLPLHSFSARRAAAYDHALCPRARWAQPPLSSFARTRAPRASATPQPGSRRRVRLLLQASWLPASTHRSALLRRAPAHWRAPRTAACARGPMRCARRHWRANALHVRTSRTRTNFSPILCPRKSSARKHDDGS